ncbi:MAG: ferric reductase-like protein [Caldilinea sp. CFX5]|nr:ferric reductase-like protein [Caldilinea sp. CFX5]
MWTILLTTAKKSPVSLRLLTGLIIIELLLLLWWLFPPLVAYITGDGTLWASEKLAWYLTRSSGAVAYIILSASTVWGLLLSTRVIKEWVPAAVALTMHETLSWLAAGLAAFHALVLLFDHYYTYTLSNLLIPFTGPYQPLWVGLGMLAFYLLLLLSASFYARRWLGARQWRRLHYLTFGVYVLITLHGWLAGTDSATFGWLYGASAFTVIFLTIYRIIAISGSAQALPHPKRQRATN